MTILIKMHKVLFCMISKLHILWETTTADKNNKIGSLTTLQLNSISYTKLELDLLMYHYKHEHIHKVDIFIWQNYLYLNNAIYQNNENLFIWNCMFKQRLRSVSFDY